MSRCSAEFWTPTGEFIGHGLYNNTVDQLMPWVVESNEAAWALYYERGADGKTAWDRYVACKHPGQPCVIWIDHERYWDAAWCPECRVVSGTLEDPPYFDPEWAPLITQTHTPSAATRSRTAVPPMPPTNPTPQTGGAR